MSETRNSPKAKLIKPDATASCQLNLGRLTEVKTKGAVSSSVKHHPADRPDPEQKQVGRRQNWVTDNRQDDERDGGRSGKTVH
jgi:hypothetical protein